MTSAASRSTSARASRRIAGERRGARVSRRVKDLVVGSGITFEDRGLHVLKGVPGEWRVFAVDA